MSIWGTSDVAGEDDDCKPDGSVVAYINGWSNHYPGHFPDGRDDKVTEETPACVGTAWMPAWCVPGIDRSLEWESTHDVDTHLGPWLRLDVSGRKVSIWTDPPTIGPDDCHSVCMNEDAVRALRDNLNEWLDREKVYPK